MKKYSVKFRKVFKGPAKKIVEASQIVDANTFKEARDIIRTEHNNAMSIDISEVPDSFRENTREEDIAYASKYRSNYSNKAITNHLGKQSVKVNLLDDKDLVKETILNLIRRTEYIKEAIMEELIFIPKRAITIEDKIIAVLETANIIDYKEEFIVYFDSGIIEVKQISIHDYLMDNLTLCKKELRDEVTDDVRDEVYAAIKREMVCSE